MIFPTVHLNGTSREELIRQNMDSAMLIGQAIDSMCKGRPHGRDYYPQDNLGGLRLNSAGAGDSYRTASAEYEARIEKLNSVFKELLAIHEYLEYQSR